MGEFIRLIYGWSYLDFKRLILKFWLLFFRESFRFHGKTKRKQAYQMISFIYEMEQSAVEKTKNESSPRQGHRCRR